MSVIFWPFISFIISPCLRPSLNIEEFFSTDFTNTPESKLGLIANMDKISAMISIHVLSPIFILYF